jgi:hypothetical protein
MDLLTVLTCTTKRSQYLLDTLRQLDNEGAADVEKIVLSDGPMTIKCPWRFKEKADGPSGARWAHWWAFKTALEMGADRVLYCEDDLIVGKNAVTKALAVEIPETTAFVTFHDRKEYPNVFEYGLRPVTAMGLDTRGMWGLQCVMFPRRTLEYLTQKGPTDWKDPFSDKMNSGDVTISWALQYSPWPQFTVHTPSLIEHAGDISSIKQKAVRRSVNYGG